MLMKNKKQFEEEGPILTNPDFFLKLAIFQLGIGPPPLSPPHRKMNGKKSINRVSRAAKHSRKKKHWIYLI